MKYGWLSGIFTVCLVLTNQALAYTSGVSVALKSVDGREEQRKLYQQAEAALDGNALTRYEALKDQLKDYPLSPYLERKRLLRFMSRASNQEIARFLKEFEGTPLTRGLHHQWLKHLWESREHQLFLAHYADFNDAELECKKLSLALDGTEAEKAELLQSIDQLWLHGDSQPKACDPLFTYWTKEGRRTAEIIHARMELSATQAGGKLVPYLASLLPADQRYLGYLWNKTRANPAFVANSHNFSGKAPLQEKSIIIYGLARLAWRNPEQAEKAWNKWQSLREFKAYEEQEIVRTLALSYATDGAAKASEWLAKVTPDHLDNSIMQWRLAQALREQNWVLAQQWLSSAPPAFQQSPAGLYWAGRVSLALGNTEAAHALLAPLASQRHYYGFLAAAVMNSAPQLQNAEFHLAKSNLDVVFQMSGLQRAFELFQIGQLTDARRELYYLNQRANEEQRQAMAALLHSWGWHEQTIFMLADSEHRDDVNKRFPMAFSDTIRAASQTRNIDAAWAFAISRQESAFMADARSHVGARGLMQIMPATARQVAREFKVKYRSSRELLNPVTNVSLGTAYLKKLLKDYQGNFVFATAAYNAGPHRVDSWQKNADNLPMDVWVETIPFHETRNYVKNVMAYKQVYSELLGTKKRYFNNLVSGVLLPAQVSTGDSLPENENHLSSSK